MDKTLISNRSSITEKSFAPFFVDKVQLNHDIRRHQVLIANLHGRAQRYGGFDGIILGQPGKAETQAHFHGDIELRSARHAYQRPVGSLVRNDAEIVLSKLLSGNVWQFDPEFGMASSFTNRLESENIRLISKRPRLPLERG
jgi:hypothetical protein